MQLRPSQSMVFAVALAPFAAAGEPSDALTARADAQPLTPEAWLETGALAGGLQSDVEATAVRLGGFVRTRFANSSDVDVSGADLGGFSVDFARLELDGGVGPFTVHVSLDGSSSAPGTPATYGTGNGHWGMFGDVEQLGGVTVLDAHATYRFAEHFHVRAGQFLLPFSANSAIRDNEQLFLSHTANGEHWRFRDQGLQLGGAYERLDWRFAVTNGFDSAGDELALFARVSAELLDLGGPTNEGALGAGDGRHLRVGAGYYNDDGNTPDDIAMTLDANFVTGPFSAALELVQYDDGATSSFSDNLQGLTTMAGDRTAFTVQGGWLFDPAWEAALRFEDLGDDGDTSVLSFGLNHYLHGHAAKLQIVYSSASSDVSTLEADILAIGSTVSI